jgi:hypothetical protein
MKTDQAAREAAKAAVSRRNRSSAENEALARGEALDKFDGWLS